MTVFEYYMSGGPVMHPLLICSVVALTVVVERAILLRRSRVVPKGFAQLMFELIRLRRWEAVTLLCQKRQCAAGRLGEVLVANRGLSREALKQRVEEAGRREAAEFDRYLPFLAAIGTVAPLLGLLGTVGGMILTFEVLKSEGEGTAQNLAGGLSQALIATYGGLVVAIPVVLAHRWLQSTADQRVIELEEVVLAAADLMEPGP